MSERKNTKRNKTRPQKIDAGLVQSDTANRSIERYKNLDDYERKLLGNGQY